MKYNITYSIRYGKLCTMFNASYDKKGIVNWTCESKNNFRYGEYVQTFSLTESRNLINNYNYFCQTMPPFCYNFKINNEI